jgi:hypothetical protein
MVPKVRSADGPKRLPRKIQAIYRRKCGTNYNARPCDGERKAAGAGTMENRRKNRGAKQ